MIIGISGKLNSGKDTVGKIIQILTQSPHFTNKAVVDFLDRDLLNPKFENKKFADTLKDFICMLLGCTREELEDREFKESPLPEEWWIFELKTLESRKIVPYLENKEDSYINKTYSLVKTTPRLLLQLMGTECGRNILHPNIWVNAVMSNYKPIDYISVPNDDRLHGESYTEILYPNWVITDMRFPNELRAVEERGITIRVNRPKKDKYEIIPHFDGSSHTERKPVFEHPSETALDNAEFDYVIENTGTIKDLVDKVKEILIKENII